MTGLERERESMMVESGAVALRLRGSRRPSERTEVQHGWLTRWEPVVATAAAVAAVVAVWMTLRADFLAWPGWLAAQKADIILGPVLVGLYWLRRRPASRFGPVLIAVGFLSVPYVLQSSASSWAFSFGVLWEGPIAVITLALVLAFPTGRLDGTVERLILIVGVIGIVAPITLAILVAPQIAGAASISSCSGACPANAFLISSHPALAGQLLDAARVTLAALDLAIMALIARRFLAGTPPRRRALAIGTPIALVFLGAQLVNQISRLVNLDAGLADDIIRGTVVAARATIWYGFLLALVAAQLFAGRVLRRLVEASLRRPSLREIEAMLRGPIGDPGLRLAFWGSDRSEWINDHGVPVETPAGRMLTTVERDGRPAVAVIHDAQLAEDLELVHAAGAVALLAKENAELELAWQESLRELRDSRARIASARDAERRMIERDLHDGAQQQLTALLVRAALVGELLPQGSAAHAGLAQLETGLEEVLVELRRLGHGIYPAPLAENGIVGALTAVAARSAAPIVIAGNSVGRYPPQVESAVYYCCLEAVQNATKHGGTGVEIAIKLNEVRAELRFEVRDDGPGFDPSTPHDGVGLRNMRDRIDALHGRLEIATAPGRGSRVAGVIPLG